MIRIFAPHPDYRILIFLPNAEWGDTQRLESTTRLHRSMDGQTHVTHVRRLPDIRALELQLTLTRLKSLELLSFFELFGAEKMKLEFDDSTSRVGYLRINPMELEIVRRAIIGSSKELVSTTLDFETVQ